MVNNYYLSVSYVCPFTLTILFIKKNNSNKHIHYITFNILHDLTCTFTEKPSYVKSHKILTN